MLSISLFDVGDVHSVIGVCFTFNSSHISGILSILFGISSLMEVRGVDGLVSCFIFWCDLRLASLFIMMLMALASSILFDRL